MTEPDPELAAALSRSGLFDRDWYLALYPDVSAAGVDPLRHYMRHGAAEGRNPSPRFNTTWYLDRYADVRASGMNPLVHFFRHGRGEGRRGGPDWGVPADIGERIHAYRSAASGARREIAVCTAIVGGHDTLMVPLRLDPRLDYVCFTDRASETGGVWKRRPPPGRHRDPRRTARYVKTHLPELLPEYDYAVWIDGNILIRGDVRAYVERVAHRGLALGLAPHATRDCVYQEAEACKLLRQDPDEVIDRQMARYRQAGIPPHAGLFATSFYVAHLHHPLATAFYRRWWEEIDTYSCRDQLSVGWALRVSGLPFGLLFPPGVWAGNHADFVQFSHAETRAFVVPECLAEAARS